MSRNFFTPEGPRLVRSPLAKCQTLTSSLRRRSTRRSVRRRRLRFRHFLFRRLLRRLGVIHNNLLRWRRWRRGQRLDLRAQTRQLIFLARRQFLHALAKRTPGSLESVHVVAQVLKLILRSERPRIFHHRTKVVIQHNEIAVELKLAPRSSGELFNCAIVS